jgi:hypothetical protein
LTAWPRKTVAAGRGSLDDMQIDAYCKTCHAKQRGVRTQSRDTRRPILDGDLQSQMIDRST